MENDTKKKCFIITPIGNEASEIRKKAEGIISAVIRPILADLEFDIYVPHEMSSPGSITDEIIYHILKDELVIANLTGLNANVMYELAIRHAAKRPVVCIAERGTQLPFDVVADRVLFYDDAMCSVVSTTEDLRKMIKEAIEQKEVEINNPIYRSVKNKKAIIETIDKNDNEDEKVFYKYLMDRFDRIEGAISRLSTASKYIERPISNEDNSFEFMFDGPEKGEVFEPEKIVNYIYKRVEAYGVSVSAVHCRKLLGRNKYAISFIGEKKMTPSVFARLLLDVNKEFGLMGLCISTR